MKIFNTHTCVHVLRTVIVLAHVYVRREWNRRNTSERKKNTTQFLQTKNWTICFSSTSTILFGCCCCCAISISLFREMREMYFMRNIVFQLQLLCIIIHKWQPRSHTSHVYLRVSGVHFHIYVSFDSHMLTAHVSCVFSAVAHTLLLFSPTLSGCASNYKIIRIIISENGKANTILSLVFLHIFSSFFFFFPIKKWK